MTREEAIGHMQFVRDLLYPGGGRFTDCKTRQLDKET